MPSLYSMVPLEQPAKPAAAARTEREDSTELQLNASAEQVAEPQAEPSMDVQATAYDPKASDPSRAGAEGSYLWELVRFHVALLELQELKPLATDSIAAPFSSIRRFSRAPVGHTLRGVCQSRPRPLHTFAFPRSLHLQRSQEGWSDAWCLSDAACRPWA